MKTPEQLINNIIGQLNGIKKMLGQEKKCEDILIQLKASKSGINSIMNKIIDQDFSKCIKATDKNKFQKLIKSIIESN